MAYLQSSGAISMSDINSVFGWGTDLHSYNGRTWYKADGSSGTFSWNTISMSDFYSTGPTAAAFTATIYSHENQLNLRSWALANGWNGSSPATITLASGYYLYSTWNAVAALTIDGYWPGGVTFINNGYIIGQGGHGGGCYYNGSAYTYNYEISYGGPAISLGVSCTIQNNSYIGGGGGGGGSVSSTLATGGGGAGGGAGGSFNSNGTWYYGGSGGGIGSMGGDGATSQNTGGGGGRIIPGANRDLSLGIGGGTLYSTGGGYNNSGSSSASGTSTITANAAGLGGQGGGTGGAYSSNYGTNYYAVGGGGGGWGASGGSGNGGIYGPGQSGASGGYCVYLNGYSITWSATGTRYGAIG